jgi:hypothetical protein
MASIFFRSGPAGGRVVFNVLGDAVQHTPVVRRTRPGNGTRPPKSFAQTKIALVRAEGLEPPQLSSLEPKPSASTSSATPAQRSSSGGTAASGGLIAWGGRFAAKKWLLQCDLRTQGPSVLLDILSGK